MAKTIEGNVYYTVPEAAKKIGISHMTLYRLIEKAENKEVTKKELPFELGLLKDNVTGSFFLPVNEVDQIAANRFTPIHIGK